MALLNTASRQMLPDTTNTCQSVVHTLINQFFVLVLFLHFYPPPAALKATPPTP